MIGTEAEIDLRQLDQTVDGQPAAREERQRQRELRDDESATKQVTTAADGSPALLQGFIGVRSDRLPRRSAAEEHAAHHGDPEGEQHDRHVQADIRFRRQGKRRHHRHDDLEEHPREPDAQRSANTGQHEALRQQLAEDLGRRRAERRPHRDLALTRGSARQEQVGDVGARDQENERDGAEQQPQATNRLLAEKVVLERLDARAPAFVRRRIRRRDVARDHVHVGVCLGQRHPVLEPAEHQQKVKVVVDLFGRERQRHVESVLHAIARAWRDDPDNDIGLAVQPDRPSDNLAIGAEPFLPQLVAQNDDLVFPGRPFFRTEVAAKKHGVSDRRRPPGSDRRSLDLLGTIARRQVHTTAGPRVQALKSGTLRLPVEIVGRRAGIAEALDLRPDHDDPIGLRVRQRGEQCGIHDAEDRRVGGNPHGQGEHRHCREARISPEQPQTVSNVSDHCAHCYLHLRYARITTRTRQLVQVLDGAEGHRVCWSSAGGTNSVRNRPDGGFSDVSRPFNSCRARLDVCARPSTTGVPGSSRRHCSIGQPTRWAVRPRCAR